MADNRRPYGALPGSGEVFYDTPERSQPPPHRSAPIPASRSTAGSLGDLERAYLDAKDAYDASQVEFKRWLDRAHPNQLGQKWDDPSYVDFREGRDRAARAGAAAQQRLSEARTNLKRGRALPHKLLKGATAGLAGLGATGLAKVAAAKSLGAMGAPIEYLLDAESRSPTQFLQGQEEFLTGLPGLVSPSELPPPAALSPDRLKAVEATQGLVGVAQDFESGVVTEQEVRAYVANKFAKGDKLPAWAEKITSMKGGRLSIKPVNPRAKARQEAAAPRPHNPRMGPTKRKHGGY